jgi:hypothetical protein
VSHIFTDRAFIVTGGAVVNPSRRCASGIWRRRLLMVVVMVMMVVMMVLVGISGFIDCDRLGFLLPVLRRGRFAVVVFVAVVHYH